MTVGLLLAISFGGAPVVLVGPLYTARNYRLSHRGQVTDRLTNALERLGSDWAGRSGRPSSRRPAHHRPAFGHDELAALVGDLGPTDLVRRGAVVRREVLAEQVGS
ncbi:hypothetical protein GCM10022225_37280 [Plantactinospora mayteni]|uniref:Uncharacterized protein n=1 Tax=Plantactinospora mayteni TaxID=566021 RepID=A0ABQ4EKM5_9ACTN|nr:hypothetical protein [Plantactinospora mayteni]GIG95308.1 hypothetical protein Pma05_18810 [Plantactinospora mayteni]